MKLIKSLEVFSPMGKASDFCALVDIPLSSENGGGVMVSVRDVFTPMDIAALCRGSYYVDSRSM